MALRGERWLEEGENVQCRKEVMGEGWRIEDGRWREAKVASECPTHLHVLLGGHGREPICVGALEENLCLSFKSLAQRPPLLKVDDSHVVAVGPHDPRYLVRTGVGTELVAEWLVEGVAEDRKGHLVRPRTGRKLSGVFRRLSGLLLRFVGRRVTGLRAVAPGSQRALSAAFAAGLVGGRSREGSEGVRRFNCQHFLRRDDIDFLFLIFHRVAGVVNPHCGAREERETKEATESWVR